MISVEQYREGFDLVVRLIEAMGHMGIIEDNLRSHQFFSRYQPLTKHPAYIAADRRRKDEFWAHLERATERVDKWPKWMKGERENRRPNRNVGAE